MWVKHIETMHSNGELLMASLGSPRLISDKEQKKEPVRPDMAF
jgi:hypothetical protein